jgi:hypothetical protein
MKKLLLAVLIIGLTNVCFSQGQLAESKTIQKTFSESEINDLQMLFNFFNQSICEPDRALDDCYMDFFRRVQQRATLDSLYFEIPFDQQKKVYEQFQDSTFHQIWTFMKIWKHQNRQDTLKELIFSRKGKFMDFLIRAGQDNEFIRDYHEDVMVMGDPSPVMKARIISLYDQLNMEDIRVKFVIAYIT